MRAVRGSGAVGLAASLAPALAGLVASAMLVVDYVRPAPVFCVEGGACDALKHTAYAMPLGVPLPIFGVAGFLALGIAALVPGLRARQVQLALALGAGMVGATLLVVQARMGRLCPYCCVADGSGLLSLAVAAGRLWLGASAPAPGRWVTAGGAGSLAAGLVVPLATGFHVSPTPQVIRDEMARTPPGEVTVVDFVDFECPFCRMTHADLEPMLAAHAGKVRVVRRQVPLRIHEHALDAARAACCGEKLGKGEAMADALFSAPVEELTPEGCERIAVGLGLPADAYRDCVHSPATDALIAADRAEFKAAHGYALPTIWIDGTPVVGAQPAEELARVLEAALARAGS